MAKTKKLTYKELSNRADRLCSWAVRYGEADQNGIVTCITCGKRLPAREAHCCHFIGRACRPLRWDPRNIHGGCPFCNTYLNGNLARYALWMQKHYTPHLVKQFLAIEDKWKAGKLKAPKMAEMRKIYNDSLAWCRRVEKAKGIQLAPKSWKEE